MYIFIGYHSYSKANYLKTLSFFDIMTLNCHSITTSDLTLCRKKSKSFLELNPSLCVLVEVNQNNWGIKKLTHHFRYELRNYRIILHENVAIQRRGMMILLNKSFPLKLVFKEAIDLNCLKLSMKYEDTTFGFFSTYAPSRGLDTEFLLNVRRNHINSTKEWLDSEDLQDAFRHLNPETLSYTW